MAGESGLRRQPRRLAQRRVRTAVPRRPELESAAAADDEEAALVMAFFGERGSSGGGVDGGVEFLPQVVHRRTYARASGGGFRYADPLLRMAVCAAGAAALDGGVAGERHRWYYGEARRMTADAVEAPSLERLQGLCIVSFISAELVDICLDALDVVKAELAASSSSPTAVSSASGPNPRGRTRGELLLWRREVTERLRCWEMAWPMAHRLEYKELVAVEEGAIPQVVAVGRLIYCAFVVLMRRRGTQRYLHYVVFGETIESDNSDDDDDDPKAPPGRVSDVEDFCASVEASRRVGQLLATFEERAVHVPRILVPFAAQAFAPTLALRLLALSRDSGGGGRRIGDSKIVDDDMGDSKDDVKSEDDDDPAARAYLRFFAHAAAYSATSRAVAAAAAALASGRAAPPLPDTPHPDPAAGDPAFIYALSTTPLLSTGVLPGSSSNSSSGRGGGPGGAEYGEIFRACADRIAAAAAGGWDADRGGTPVRPPSSASVGLSAASTPGGASLVSDAETGMSSGGAEAEALQLLLQMVGDGGDGGWYKEQDEALVAAPAAAAWDWDHGRW
ncbi:hypothetical protein HK405_006631 [Cladochytrium tenue]|nr:hypothetical protein HK405_006631 [Cladochytrium tenue]